jgi:formamidopyrimidine-DNA glycosylase
MPEAAEIFYLKELIKSKINNNIFEQIISNTKTKVVLPKHSKVINCDTKGKLMWIQTEDYYVHLHMMISGWLVFEEPKICKYEFIFNNMSIYLDDTRRFSKVDVITSEKKHQDIINKLGLDFLKNEVSQDQFINILSNSKKNISALFLDQTIFCGIGNYIRNEVLYMVKLHPMTISNKINEVDIIKLYKKIKYVMFSNLYELMNEHKLPISKFITQISPETLQVPYKYRVYGKTKDKFGNNIIKKKIAGRWAYYVPSIQK